VGAHAVARDAAGGAGGAEAGRYVTLGTAVVILLILAAIVSNLRDPGWLPAILFAGRSEDPAAPLTHPACALGVLWRSDLESVRAP
jgi:hypothetical protein